MCVLCCPKVGSIVEIQGVTFLVVSPKDKFANLPKFQKFKP